MIIAIKSFLATVLTALMTFNYSVGLYTDQINTLRSIQKVEDNLYVMDYTYDYDIDRLMRFGVSNHIGLILRTFAYATGDIFHGGCTCFTSQTDDGDYLLSRNYDYMEDGCLVVWTHPKNGYASISTVPLEFLGYFEARPGDPDFLPGRTLFAPYVPVDGMNEKGLAISIMEVEKKPEFQVSLKRSMTSSTMVRACLDKAATVEEAIKIFESYDMRDFLLIDCSYHYHITDASGNSCVIEYVNGEISIVRPDNESEEGYNFQVSTNFFLTEGVDDPDGAGYERYDTAFADLKKVNGITNEDDAMNILEDCCVIDQYLSGFVCTTLWSVVYNKTDRFIDLVHLCNYGKTYRFSLDKPSEYLIKD